MKFKLAIIDDDPSIGEYVQMFAGEAGFEARSWTSVASFKEDYAGFSPDIVISDIVMPEQDGIELIGYLAEKGFGGFLLLISRYHQLYLTGAEEIADARGLRRLPSLAKPFSEDIISTVLTDAMAILKDEKLT